MWIVPSECTKCKEELTINLPMYQWANGDIYTVCPKCGERINLIEED